MLNFVRSNNVGFHAFHKFDNAQESILFLIKEFGNCYGEASEPKCLKIQSVVKEFLLRHLPFLDFCKVKTNHTIRWIQCGMGKETDDIISVEARIQPKMLWIRDMDLNLNLVCKTLENFDPKSRTNVPFSFDCTVNNDLFLQWTTDNDPSCQICDSIITDDFKKLWKDLRSDCYELKSADIFSCFEKAVFLNYKEKATCYQDLNSNCFEKAVIDRTSLSLLADQLKRLENGSYYSGR